MEPGIDEGEDWGPADKQARVVVLWVLLAVWALVVGSALVCWWSMG